MTNAQLTTTFGNDVKVAELTSGDATTLNFSTVTMPVVWMASEAGMARTMQTMTQTKEKKCFS